jgi:UDP-N-acetylglucosamine:LPS N-acetylglucosamine transferase
MAHVLLGWEFGGNRGHATSLLAIADALRKRGHRISFALQRVDALAPDQLHGAEVWPAPVTPRLLINTSRPNQGHPQTMGDIAARLGFDDAELMEALVRAWRQLLAAIRPDLVISDYGPFLLTAARERVPTVSVGTAFSTPPSVMEAFPNLGAEPPLIPEGDVLASVNMALARLDTPRLQRLPQIFEASRELGGSFTELDPYAASRVDPLVAPMLRGGAPALAPSGGDEIFVYAPEQVRIEAALWKGLVQSGLPIRVHVANMDPHMQRGLAEMGLTVEPKPLPFARIAERSRLVISHGGHGFVCSALLAGLPQVICHFDLEKQIHANAITTLGLGGMVPMIQIEPEAFAASLGEVYHNEDLASRARAAAPGFQSRYELPMEESVANAAEALIG